MALTKDVLDDWYKRVSVTQRAHYMSADYFGKKKYLLGIPALILSTIVGTTVFASLQKQPNIWLQIGVGFASVIAALLTSLQTFLNYSERAEKHRVAGAKYGALGRELELLASSPTEPDGEILKAIKSNLDTLALESPNNPNSIYAKAGSGKLFSPDY